jgi:TrmH family RNA methyltransferase
MVSMITSTQNERVKYLRSLGRRRVRQREDRFAVEGTRLAEEVLRAGVKPALVLYTEAWSATAQAQRLLPSLARAEEGCWLVAEAVMATCTATKTPQGIVAVVPRQQLEAEPGLVLILDGLRDPGNLGTILRSAEATGAGQVILAPGTVDPYNPKVVRGAMGAHFRLPVASMGWPAIVKRMAGRPVWLADATAETPYDTVDWGVAAGLIVGGEAVGAGEEAKALATGRVGIPMAGGAESLNAAMAATVILFEAAKQHRRSTVKES